MTMTHQRKWGRDLTSEQIRATTEALRQRRPLDAERLLAARNLLLRGGWWLEDDGVLHFVSGVTVSERCSCQEGNFILCLHLLAVQILAALPVRRRPPLLNAGWPRAIRRRAGRHKEVTR